jgi:hypothetical protein
MRTARSRSACRATTWGVQFLVTGAPVTLPALAASHVDTKYQSCFLYSLSVPNATLHTHLRLRCPQPRHLTALPPRCWCWCWWWCWCVHSTAAAPHSAHWAATTLPPCSCAAAAPAVPAPPPAATPHPRAAAPTRPELLLLLLLLITLVRMRRRRWWLSRQSLRLSHLGRLVLLRCLGSAPRGPGHCRRRLRSPRAAGPGPGPGDAARARARGRRQPGLTAAAAGTAQPTCGYPRVHGDVGSPTRLDLFARHWHTRKD